MHHEATACHVTDDILALLILTQQILSAARKFIADKKGDKYIWEANFQWDKHVLIHQLIL